MYKNKNDLSSKGALQKALRKALKPGLKSMTLAVEKTYGPDALGYREPSKTGEKTDPEEFMDQYVLRYAWYHNVIQPLHTRLKALPDAHRAGVLGDIRARVQDILIYECAADGDDRATLPDVPYDVKDQLYKSAQEALELIQQYADLHPDTHPSLL